MIREYKATWRDQCGAVLHPCAKGYRWQVTRFDADGFSGDSLYNDARRALRDLRADGYIKASGVLEPLAMTERFAKGNELTQLVGMINAGADHSAVMAAYAAGGLVAARALFAQEVNHVQH